MRSELVRKLTEEKKEEMEFLKVTKACKMKLVVVGEEKNKKSKSKNLVVGSYLQISFSSAKKTL